MRRTAFKAHERWAIYNIKNDKKTILLQELTGEEEATLERIITTNEHPADTTKIQYEENTNEEQATNEIKIYTDGSKTEEGTGYAYVVYKNKKEIEKKQIKCNDTASVFQCELAAINEAVGYIAENNEKQTKFTLLTDSKSALEAIKNRRRRTQLLEDTTNRIKRCKKDIKWRWVKAHAGTAGNERADELAKAATKETDVEHLLPIPVQTIKQKLRVRTINKEKYWYETTSNGKTTRNILPKYEQATKTTGISTKLMQLFTGHGNIKNHLKNRLGKIDDDTCECGIEPQTAEHLLFTCPIEERARGVAEREKGGALPTNWNQLNQWYNEDRNATKIRNKMANAITALDQSVPHSQSQMKYDTLIRNETLTL